MAKALPGRRRFGPLPQPPSGRPGCVSHPNGSGPSACDEGPLDGLCPVLPGVADGIQNGDLSC